MKIFLTNLPSFYKINLYNSISDYIEVMVVYTGRDLETRNSDFLCGSRNFREIQLHGSEWKKALQFKNLLKNEDYTEVIVAGWDNLSSWMGALVSPKSKNSVVIESSILESKSSGIKGLLKRLFITRIARAYCSGKSQVDLARAVGFRGEIVITKGVGVFNYRKQPVFIPRKEVKHFIYVGRLVWEKNLDFLISQFNRHPELSLDIIGYGELEIKLKSLANTNIRFIGAVDNKELYKYYEQADIFVLASVSEPWGLVVEEALNNGLPVMVSDRVGCAEEIVNSDNGVVFHLTEDDFDEKLNRITNLEEYNRMRYNISKMDFESIENKQVLCYV